MINYFSKLITNYLLKSKVIDDSEDEKEYYQYGIEITISSILNIVLIIIIGVIFKSVIESMIFLFLFIPIRQFTGGYHADTYLKCNLIFCSLYTIVLLLSHATYAYLTTYATILVSFVCIILILYMCPIEHINKPIPKKHRKKHKLMAALLGAVYGILATALTALLNRYGALVLYTLLLVTLLIIAAKIKEMRRCKYEEKNE